MIQKDIPLKKLRLDLNNFRTVPMKDEESALHSMATISPERFWGVFSSLTTYGFLRNDLPIVIEGADGRYTVAEGNRRVASLKLAHGILKGKSLRKPKKADQEKITEAWKRSTRKIPCVVYPESEIETVKSIVAMIHGYNAKAGRDEWESIAKARFERFHGAPNPLLDVFEHFLETRTIISGNQAESWAVKYPFTLLDEAVKKAAKAAEVTVAQLTSGYGTRYTDAMNALMKKVGDGIDAKKGDSKKFGYDEVRDPESTWETECGFIPNAPADADPEPEFRGHGKKAEAKPAAPPALNPQPKPTGVRKKSTPSATDPRSVRAALKDLVITDPARAKVSQLREEICDLRIKAHPLVFCIAMRSLVETTVRSYARLHKISPKEQNAKGEWVDKQFSVLLDEVASDYIRHNRHAELQPELDSLTKARNEFMNKGRAMSWGWLSDMAHGNAGAQVVLSEALPQFHLILPLLQKLNA